MGSLIVFYCFFAIYTFFVSIYIKKTKNFLCINQELGRDEILSEFTLVSRNILYITVGLLILAIGLLYKYKTSLTPNLVGLSLACLTAVFYIVFVVWDVIQDKIIAYFKQKQIIIERKDIFGLIQVLTIICFSFLLFFVSVTIMIMIITV